MYTSDIHGKGQSTGVGLSEIVSNNSRLEQIFSSNPDYVNREQTLPCLVADPLYLSESVTRELAENVEAHNRAIVLPKIGQASIRSKKDLRVLASPYECGRVLEYDHRLTIGSTPYVFTVKGIGATNFYRSTSGNNPWMIPHHRRDDFEEKTALQTFPFYQDRGCCNKKNAIEEKNQAALFAAEGIDAERILAIYPVLAIPNHTGEMREVNELKQLGIIHPEVEPVLLHRAMKSNLRLLDVMMLNATQRRESIPHLSTHALDLYREHSGSAQATLTDYYSYLTSKVISQELSLILRGFNMGSGFWDDLARNISIMGEELDLEGVTVNETVLLKPRSYLEHVKSHFRNTLRVLILFGDKLNQYLGDQIDPFPMKKVFLEAIRYAATSDNLRLRFDGFLKEFRKQYSYPEFQHCMLAALSSEFIDYCGGVHSQGFVCLQDDLTDILKRKLIL